MASEMKNGDLELISLIKGKLHRLCPFEIKDFSVSKEENLLVGDLFLFKGSLVRSTTLTVKYIRPTDLRAVDAISAEIERGDKLFFLPDFLLSVGEDPAWFSNMSRLETEVFVMQALDNLKSMERFESLQEVLSGGTWIDVPFDWAGYR